MHLPFPHENSLIEHFWLPPVEDFADCFAPWITRIVTTKHRMSATVLIFIAFIFWCHFLSLSPRFRSHTFSVLRLNLYCFEHFFPVRIIDRNSHWNCSWKIYLHFVTSLSLLGLLSAFHHHSLPPRLEQITIWKGIEKEFFLHYAIKAFSFGTFLSQLFLPHFSLFSVSRFPLDLCVSRMWRDFRYFFSVRSNFLSSSLLPL